jgi:hypothetical protein
MGETKLRLTVKELIVSAQWLLSPAR